MNAVTARGGWAAALPLALGGCVAGALLAPSSWWGVAFVAVFVATMASLRDRVPERYRAGWTRATALTTVGAALGAGSYAFAVEPFGYRPLVSWLLGLLLATYAAGLLGTDVVSGGGSAYEKLRRYERQVGKTTPTRDPDAPRLRGPRP